MDFVTFKFTPRLLAFSCFSRLSHDFFLSRSCNCSSNVDIRSRFKSSAYLSRFFSISLFLQGKRKKLPFGLRNWFEDQMSWINCAEMYYKLNHLWFESWIPYWAQVRALQKRHQRKMHRILHMKWSDYISNTHALEVAERANPGP